MENDIKWSTQKNIMFQAGIIKLTTKPKIEGDFEQRLRKLEEKINSGNIDIKPQNRVKENKTEQPKAKEQTEKKQETKKENISNITSTEYWTKVIANLRKKGKLTLFTNLMNTKAVELNDLQIGIVGLTSFGKTVVEQPENRQAIMQAILEETGKDMQIKIEEVKNVIQKQSQKDFDIPINIIEE